MGSLQSHRYLAGTIIAFLIFVSCSLNSAAEIVISGRVLTGDNEVVHFAKVEIFQNTQPMTFFPEPVDMQGKFKIRLEDFSGTHITCKVSAPNYKPQKLTFLVEYNNVELGDIFLEYFPLVQFSEATHSVAADNSYQSIDLYVSVQSDHPVEVTNVNIFGVRKVDTGCLSGGPNFIININNQISDSIWAASIEEPSASWHESIAINGKVEILSCDQIRMSFLISTAFQINSKNKKKFRVKLPRTISVSKPKLTRRTLDLEFWESMHIEFVLNDGTVISKSLKHL